MSEEEVKTGEAGGGGSLTEQAGETTAADMVRGPEPTKPVGADTMAQVGGAPGAEKKGGGE